MQYTYDISIVIVNYNVRYFIAECLESFRRSNLGGLRVEVFVVDNDSIDGSVQMIESNYPEVKLIANKDNVGFSTANNQAIKIAQGKYILLLNPDTVLEEDTLKICFDYAETHPDVGAIGVKMIDGAGKFLPESKRALPTPWNSLTKLVGLAGIFPKSKLFNGYALGYLPDDQRHSIEVLCGAFMFMPRAVIDKVGMLDERFFMYGEDIDLSYRIIKGGYEIHYVPDTTIIHYKGESTKKGSLNYVKTFYNAMSLYVNKHYTGAGATLFGRFLQMGIWLRAGVSAFRRLLDVVLPMVVDGALIALGLYLFSKIWATYYFGDATYYDKSPLSWNIVLYSMIWVGTAWLIGYYKKNTWQKRLQVVGIGLVMILSVYALLDVKYRPSRIITLGGAIVSGIVFSLTTYVRKLIRSDEQQKKVLIVSHHENAQRIVSNLKKTNVPVELLGTVCPTEGIFDSDLYLNTVAELDRLTKVLKADEVIFSTESMTTKDIMKHMVELDSRLSFKIVGDESLSILGSKSSNTSGEIYNVDIHYNLNIEYYKHIKRVLDVLVALLFVVLFPLLLIINKFRFLTILRAIWDVFTGTATWVGYIQDGAKINANLPILPMGIFSIKDTFDSVLSSNRNYAKTYTVWQDLAVISKQIHTIGDDKR